MIELKNITKIYKGKGSASVKALDDVSFTLPDKGLVFILGKSGCGKSTLLNIAGGLDFPTSGEIVIKGKSSEAFSKSDFDSYRNTYVGFIFQEYNVLPEFSVNENVTLATELQGKRPERERVEGILEEVELNGLEKRKPSTLSGGQKQRVAIARALVKDPQIILADEPTGALDSATGKAVLDLLKKLSHEKLVVVVSHDREFANKYADRIIELHDGKVLSDMSFVEEEAQSENGMAVIGDNVHLSKELEESMLAELNELLRSKKKLTLTYEESGEAMASGHFAPTVEEEIKNEYDPNEKLIRSKFPLKYAARMGASGLKTKRFRLILTILLSTVALTAFGFMLSLMTYDADYTLKNALDEGGQTELGVANYRVWTRTIPIVNMEYESSEFMPSDKARLEKLEKDTGLDFLKVQSFSQSSYGYMRYNMSFHFADGSNYNLFYPTDFCGFSVTTEEQLARFGGKLTKGSRMPQTSDEILISDLAAEAIYRLGVRDEKGDALMVNDEDYPIGRTLTIKGLAGSVPAKICGVFTAPRPDGKFEELKNVSSFLIDASEDSDLDEIKRLYALSNELAMTYRASLSTLCIVSESFFRSSAHLVAFSSDNAYSTYTVYFTKDDAPLYAAYFSAGAYAAEEETSALLLDGATLEANSCLLSSGGVNALLTAYFNNGIIVEDLYQELNQKLFENGKPDPENAFAVFEKLNEIDPDLLKNVRINDFNGMTHTFSIVGVRTSLMLSDEDKYDGRLYFPEECYFTFFEKSEQIDLDNADFLLCVNSPEARRIFTGKELKVKDEDGRRFMLHNNYQRENIEEYSRTIATLSNVFFWVGVVVAVFASLLLFNFISVSINYKKKDIGILRALGARKVDVFKVFFSESLMIIGACFIFSAIAALIISISFNNFLRTEFLISASLFFFGPLQALILGALSVAVAFISTVLPVHHHAKKPPVDAIRAL